MTSLKVVAYHRSQYSSCLRTVPSVTTGLRQTAKFESMALRPTDLGVYTVLSTQDIWHTKI